MRNKYKRIIALLLLACFSLTACGVNNDEDTSKNSAETSTVESTEQSIVSEETESLPSEDAESIDEESTDVESAVSEDAESLPSESASEETTSSEIVESVDPNFDPDAPLTPIPENFGTDEVDTFFDNSVFVGYSIIMHFGKYINEWKVQIDPSFMGSVTFCAAPGVSFYADKRQEPGQGNSLPTYRGEPYNIKDLPKASGCDTMYIGLMGVSELKRSSADVCVDYAYYEAVDAIERIRDENPDLNIVILSATYVTGEYKTEQLDPKKVNNENLRDYNNLVLEYCNDNGIDFIDVSSAITNGHGFMQLEYSSDKDYHIAKEPFKIWINILRDYAKQKQAGTWENITVMPKLGTKY